ncbi:efflux pump, RND family, inner membrane protein [Syntrophotalea carbinolica DSM 2380]|uniref:Efflux pump, RND family, inner membrane protein n=1 Tax=Syntrophotalea carbinolica (strain DSM 2380 / NBRC 103641 / GraBd1) TaxID=338963 RepID=Q3A7U6_SYNC1|nr:efflux RND transporter permease subunit [Syntrophotalea carbinolica]ABA87548.1 efflux pump, RND family, inner membrane protein [Syntrophotalea carbinolica DSM 2380]
MARFFINRPIFAWVVAILIMLAGSLAILTMPIAQYPPIAMPEIQVQARYPGASAQTLQDAVTQIIEQKMTGIDNLLYMTSSSDSTGQATITLTFSNATDPNMAQVQVQNKLSLATPLLPQVVQRQGISVTKSTNNYLLIMGLVSEDASMGRYEVADYMESNIKDALARLPGVGELEMFDTQHAMRVWLDPDKLNNYRLTPTDVASAIQSQNAEVSAGEFGGLPAHQGQQLNATITVRNYMQTPEEFGSIILRTNSDGSNVYLRDVAEVKVGAERYDSRSRYNGKPASAMGIKLATGANALDTADQVKAKMAELSKYFPSGLKVVYSYDTTPFTKISIKTVVHTLLEAIVLVFLVMFLFLQNFRATLIPTLAVPVVLLGTFGVLAATGFSINTLTMFAMVLAIGLLVDDAIVVVENVERIMSAEGLSPREATIKSMKEITGALWGIAIVLSAVFVPMFFFSGSAGIIYRQFSITIVTAMLLSVLVAMIFTPALCATLLKPVARGHDVSERSVFFRFFRGFNHWFDRGSGGYRTIVGRMIGKPNRYMLIYLSIVVVMGGLFWWMPTGFLPDEDQGIMFVQYQLPAGAVEERSLEVAKQIEDYFLKEEAVDSVMTVTGFSFAGRGQNMGFGFVKLKDWALRKKPELRAQAVANRATKAFSTIRDGIAFAFLPPPATELGNATGFDVRLVDRGGLGHDKLMAARDQLLGLSQGNPALTKVRPNGMDDTPMFKIDLDDNRAGASKVELGDVNDIINTAWGSLYVNDYIENGRVKKVYLQSAANFRMLPEDIGRWYVRNTAGDMVPFSAFATARWIYGSPRLERYNGLPAVEILGEPASGESSGTAMKEIEKMAAQLPAAIGCEWTGLSFQERAAGAQTMFLYATSLVVVFLCLAALYESWAIPASVMLVVPLGVVGALLAASARGFSNDVYFQIAILTTIGLSAKNAILIVEFAKERMHFGMGLLEATVEAAQLRLRPILMTSLAFFFGVLPMALSKGAGSGAQNSIGTGLVGGIISGTLLAIFFVPVFFVVVRKVFPIRERETIAATVSEEPAVETY